MWIDCTKTVLTKLKLTYNCLRRFIGLPWHNSVSEMFVNLNIKSSGDCFEFLYTAFVLRLFRFGDLMLTSICNCPCSIFSKL